ncbi:MAG: hypothetical protein K8T89_09555 [Planctomycetes bacterium]|nr:hypothetical protein [Planctomycetota bacterium]
MRWFYCRWEVAGLALALLALVGCSGSKESEQNKPSSTGTGKADLVDPAKVDLVDPALRGLLGKQEDSKEVTEFRERLGPPSLKASDPERYIIYSWSTKGVYLHFYAKGKLKSIELRSQLYSFKGPNGEENKWADYEGELPGKLSWSDKRADVHKKLGKPESPYFERASSFPQRDAALYDAYLSQGITVGYHQPKSESDGDCRIHYIRIEEPQRK